MNLPFAEKYKPRTFDDLILDNISSSIINDIITKKVVPNIIISGKSGIGKTATLHVIAKALYPKININQILEINASDERGIKTVNDDIINFCKRCVEFAPNYAQHKLLILDEADNFTDKAQKLISSIMDTFPNVHFAFTCGTTSKMVESIISRCLTLNYMTLSENAVVTKLIKVCKLENIEYDEPALYYLYKYNNCNFRQTLNILELIYITKKKINIHNIDIICDIPSTEQFKKIITAINTHNIIELCKIIKELQNYGYYAIDVILHFIQFLRNDEYLNKIIILECLSIFVFTMSANTSNYLQLTSSFLTCIEKIKINEISNELLDKK